MALGSDCSCIEAGLRYQESGSEEQSSRQKRNDAHLNCRVTKEKIRTRALESTNTTSSFPHTNDTCTIDISAWLYHGLRLVPLPCP